MGRSPRIRRWYWLAGALIVVALLGGAGIVSSTPSGTPDRSSDVVPGLNGLDFPFAQVGWALGIIVVLIVALSMLARRFMRLPFSSGRRGRNMRVVESLSLGGRRAVLLLLVHDRALVVGVDDGRMSTLGEIRDAEFVHSLAVSPDTERSFASHFLSQQEHFETPGGAGR